VESWPGKWVGGDEARKECEEANRWSKGAGHFQAKGGKEVLLTLRKRGKKVEDAGEER
jgi:hypothetical protein